MSEEAGRQTRSQKRALERDSLPSEVDVKKMRLEKGTDHLKSDGIASPDGKVKSEMGTAAVTKVPGIFKGGEVKATIKLEVQTGDEPVDMSTAKSEIKKDRRAPSPDVIVLSDNEPSSPKMNGLSRFSKETNTEALMKSSPEERERIIKQLKEELRLEEAKLVLLKKLRQSQIQKETTTQKTTGSSSNSVATPPPLVRGTQSLAPGKGVLPVSSNRSSGTVIPPPLVRGGQPVSSKLGSQQNTQIVMPPLVRGAPPISVSPQQIHSLRQQPSGSGPPPLLLAPRASVPNVQLQGQRIIQQGLIRVANVSNTSLLVNIPQASPTNLKSPSVTSQSSVTGSSVTSVVNSNDSPASRQAAAKLALRKQLEKTLLEIPPPKPPAPELNFLPSAANNEFIYLVGLEEVVQNLLETQGKGKVAVTAAGVLTLKDPYTCAQCKTDFTCRWRQEKSGTIMCEHCMTSNQKKALKAEHTNRLKAAFVKALQQEQEIEQRILRSASPIPTSSSSAKTSEQQTLVSPQQVQHHTAIKQVRTTGLPHSRGGPIGRHHSTMKQSPNQLPRGLQSAGARGVLHTFSQSSQLQSAAAAAALVTRPGKHAVRPGSKANTSTAVNTWKKQSPLNTGVAMAYVNPSLSVHKPSSAMDRQREYLLDMIPSRSISQTANTWKS
ncbi:GATA zinc finger domain containing 2Ab isoform X1 [Polypterus senegalus]|uniref:GATA zinc finger domain containing 2Ab isoform X1 n=1 Tax=Polypterus senegalus TaxID=55291 RepID=UPI0019629AFF|nr:GATA zinc finger domain containing 2Ab isoform X1 [Polypterus senegalus]XP_039622607.1 GATA zinc finger domain containing 2Ab isoform X1 [Polypterus senegalus]XP_039622609.1 GATA zinc finger domain containing 2Ab isoform X1 [Polypterus senegalus]XP_039622610.1 GATA zinc finger domain containing 2Ab isoform X1 [Polypterus senegalus]